MKKNIGDSIKDARKNLDISQQELANRLNVTRQAVSNWENNITYPDQSLIFKICDVLNIEIQTLYGEKIDKNFNVILNKEKRRKYINFILSVLIIVLLSYFCLSLFNDSKTYIFKVNIDSNHFYLNNSYYIKSKDRNYISLDLKSYLFDIKDSKICVYYIEKNNKVIIYENIIDGVIEIDKDNTSKNKNIIKNIDSIYFDISYKYNNDSYVDTIKIKIYNTKEDFEINDKIAILKLNEDSLIRNDYHKSNNEYIKKINDYIYKYNINNNILTIQTPDKIISKNYNNKFIKIEYINDKDNRCVTIYYIDSVIKFNNNIRFDYKKELEILNDELYKIEESN